MSNGSIPFFTSTGQLSQNNSKLFWDKNNNRLGIGSANPNSTLTVNGHMALLAGAAPTDTTGYGKIYVSSGNNKLYFKDGAGSTFNLTNGATTTTPGGAITQFQFNDGSSFGGNGALSFTKASKTLTVGANTIFTVDPTATVNLNSTNLNIADTDIQLTGTNTTLTQTTGPLLLLRLPIAILT